MRGDGGTRPSDWMRRTLGSVISLANAIEGARLRGSAGAICWHGQGSPLLSWMSRVQMLDDTRSLILSAMSASPLPFPEALSTLLPPWIALRACAFHLNLLDFVLCPSSRLLSHLPGAHGSLSPYRSYGNRCRQSGNA